jgi:hypothetical protein
VATLLGPFVAIVSGAAAAWLLKHFPGMHIDQSTLGTTISEALVFAVAAAGTFAIHHKWLSGWQSYEQPFNQAAASIMAQVPPAGGSSEGVGHSTQSVEGNGHPASGAPTSLMELIDTALPTWMEELESSPAAPSDGSTLQRPDSAATPDEPVGEAPALVGVQS